MDNDPVVAHRRYRLGKGTDVDVLVRGRSCGVVSQGGVRAAPDHVVAVVRGAEKDRSTAGFDQQREVGVADARVIEKMRVLPERVHISA